MEVLVKSMLSNFLLVVQIYCIEQVMASKNDGHYKSVLLVLVVMQVDGYLLILKLSSLPCIYLNMSLKQVM